VEPDTPVKVGTRFCICYKELIPWVMLPLQIAYVTDGESDRSKMFAFGSGTLQGHLLVGTHETYSEDRYVGVVWLLVRTEKLELLYVVCAGRGGAVLGAGGRGGAGVVRGGLFLEAGARPGDAVLPVCAAEAEAFRAAVGAGAPQACGHLLDQAGAVELCGEIMLEHSGSGWGFPVPYFNFVMTMDS